MRVVKIVKEKTENTKSNEKKTLISKIWNVINNSNRNCNHDDDHLANCNQQKKIINREEERKR